MTERSGTGGSEGGSNAQALQASGAAADAELAARHSDGGVSSCGPKDGWIEIQLLGEDDRPVPGQRYRIELPDGTRKEGTLDAEGMAGLEGVSPGSCKITFPDLDRDAWEPIE